MKKLEEFIKESLIIFENNTDDIHPINDDGIWINNDSMGVKCNPPEIDEDDLKKIDDFKDIEEKDLIKVFSDPRIKKCMEHFKKPSIRYIDNKDIDFYYTNKKDNILYLNYWIVNNNAKKTDDFIKALLIVFSIIELSLNGKFQRAQDKEKDNERFNRRKYNTTMLYQFVLKQFKSEFKDINDISFTYHSYFR